MITSRYWNAWIVIAAMIVAVSGCAGPAPWQLAPTFPGASAPSGHWSNQPATAGSATGQTQSRVVTEQIRGQNAGGPAYANQPYNNNAATYPHTTPGPYTTTPYRTGPSNTARPAQGNPSPVSYQGNYQGAPAENPVARYQPPAGQPGFQQGVPGAQMQPGPPTGFVPPTIGGTPGQGSSVGISPGTLPPGPPFAPPNSGPPIGSELGLPPNFADLDVMVEEARTGRFMFGVGVNSSAGVVGQIVLDERNFDITRIPTSFQDFTNGTAFRGAGQGFRVEALPGNQVQRYMVSFTEPYLFDTPVSLSLSGFFFDRNFFDWDEHRYRGRASLGYRLTHDLSLSVGIRAEEVDIRNPRVLNEPQLNDVVGDNEVYAGQFTLTHDTRDMPFAPTEGHLIELNFQQVFGTYDYARGDAEYRRYHLIFERPDGSGRHTFSYGLRAGVSGSQTPIYDHYFAGGFSTMRGFDFRGASPVGNGGVIVGGEFQLLGSVEYQFPLTADDMIKAVAFCDFGTVEDDVRLSSDTFRVAPGFGLRVNVPAMGPAPLAFDFAFPVSSAPTDNEEVFSFFIGFGRL